MLNYNYKPFKWENNVLLYTNYPMVIFLLLVFFSFVLVLRDIEHGLAITNNISTVLSIM